MLVSFERIEAIIYSFLMDAVLENKKILIIDDEQTMLEIVTAVLKRAGAFPTGISSVKNALKASKVEQFDAIILDRYMPECDGHDVLKQLKSSPETKTTPVIMLTGEKDINEVKESVKLGAVGYITKPFTPKDFLSQLDKVLESKFKTDS